MESFLKKVTQVPFDSLFLDPNNPRLAHDDPPGYDDPAKLFAPELQSELDTVVRRDYDIGELEQAILAQGWMPIDSIVVWTYPSDPSKHIVVEGNRRTVSLRGLRDTLLPREQKKLESMQKKKNVAKHDLDAQEAYVAQIERVISDTKNLSVLPLDAKDVEELKRKLPRVLAVRHIQGVKGWGNYAEDLWLLGRYENLFSEKYPDESLRWEQTLVTQVAEEASLGEVKAKRQMQAASAFSHFKSEYEDQLPADEEFTKEDYYLFENIVKKPWLREQFGLSQDALHVEREEVLFKWVFAKPRGHKKEDNPNVFYRHENVLVWDKMHRYDDDNKTGFASRFNVDEPDTAPTMLEVEAAYMNHVAQRAPTEVLEQLLQQLGKLTTETLVSQGDFLDPKLKRLRERCDQCLRMIEATKAPSRSKSASSGR